MKTSDWCDLESHLKPEQYFFETLPSTSKKLIVIYLGKNFRDALFLCRRICGRMVLPNSQTESNELASISRRYLKSFWIRFSDVDREGYWRDFDNNAAVHFSNWASGEPHSSYDFAYISGSKGKLYARSYSNTNYVVCELP